MTDWTNMAGQLASAGAPILGGVLGGPVGGAVGSIVGGLLGKALGCEPTPAAVSAAITKDPQAAGAALQKLDTEQGHTMTLLEAEVADLANARAQTVELAKEGSGIAWGAPTVSIIVGVAFSAVSYRAIAYGISDSPAVMLLLGVLASRFGTMVDYWLGSSFGSRDKDATIASAVKSVAAKK